MEVAEEVMGEEVVLLNSWTVTVWKPRCISVRLAISLVPGKAMQLWLILIITVTCSGLSSTKEGKGSAIKSPVKERIRGTASLIG